MAHGSAFEKVSYPWAVSQVRGFREVCIAGDYIYSPEQRCKCEAKLGLCEGKWAGQAGGSCVSISANATAPSRLSLQTCCAEAHERAQAQARGRALADGAATDAVGCEQVAARASAGGRGPTSSGVAQAGRGEGRPSGTRTGRFTEKQLRAIVSRSFR